MTGATGEYELVAETDDERAVHEFSLADRDDAAWYGVCVYVGPDALRVVEVDTDGDLAVPEATCYGHRHADGENDDIGS